MGAFRTWMNARPWLSGLIVMLALLVRGVVPVGYMVSTGPQSIAITMCDGADHRVVAVKLPAKQPAEQATKDSPCAFAALGHVAHSVSTAPAPAGIPGDRAIIVRVAAPVAIGRGLAAPPPPQTGPPAFA